MNLLQFKKRSKAEAVACERCGTTLTDPESIARKMGPECAMKQADQFAAISNLTLAMTTGYFDQVAQRHFIEKRIVETRLANAKQERNPGQIIRFTKALQRINGILVSRELARLERANQRKAVA